MPTTKEKEQAGTNFWLLLASAVVLGVIAGVLFYVGASEQNIIPTLIASGASLGTVLLIGFAVKEAIRWQS